MNVFFIRKNQSHLPNKSVHEAPWSMWIGPLLLGFVGVSLPLLAGWFDSAIANPAYDTFLKPSFEYHLTFWHGFSWPLVISILSVGLGYVIFSYCRAGIGDLASAEKGLQFGPSRIYDAAINAITLYAGPFFRLFQNGYLRFYLHVILWAFVITTLAFFVPKFDQLASINFEQKTSILITLVQIIIATGAVLSVLAKRIFTAIISLGLVGFGIALIYVMHGAPDLAMTQFLVETLTLILLVLILRRMPASANLLQKQSKALSISLALAFGLVFALITYISASSVLNESVAEFYAATSVLKANGRNVVNVILVDYRGFDTMGEIAVLALAALGVHTLLKSKKLGAKK